MDTNPSPDDDSFQARLLRDCDWTDDAIVEKARILHERYPDQYPTPTSAIRPGWGPGEGGEPSD